MAQTPPPPRPANLHTLPDDLIFEILTHCPTLQAFHSLILTHPNIYNVYKRYENLVQRIVLVTHDSLPGFYFSRAAVEVYVKHFGRPPWSIDFLV
ncbi:uncharacterized protein EI97DRAFT_430890 [Westerdykella ornata]|uniref:F-box domain-containing protein n=1 Tax=Westerdykella ornata TaxID=318751 RepID=A0A6A6JQ09_WESOR|nr:uncharacterized protein EI97DRAFT_430890 [Westerdykella ornata]KAF2278622.1 hypothetical protein EI97DRAFT_430890 [Westerdykella ornata]